MHRVTDHGTYITNMRSVPKRHSRQWGNPEHFYQEITFEERMAGAAAIIVYEYIMKPLGIDPYGTV